MLTRIVMVGVVALVLCFDVRAQMTGRGHPAAPGGGQSIRSQDRQPRSIAYQYTVAVTDSGPSFYKRKSEWQKIIDEYWGPGDSYTQKLNVFNSYASYVRAYFPAFSYSHLNWDSTVAYWRAKITNATSRGAFHAILSKFMYSLNEWHAWAGDNTVWATPLRPGAPVAYYSDDARHFGAATTPLPDSSLLVYKVVPNHPLGLQRGDRLLGYEGVRWSQLFTELTDAGIGTDYLTGACPSVKEYFRLAYAGMFWHLFDTIDVVKYGTGQIVHLPTAPLTGLARSAPLLHCDQMQIPGVPMPSEELLAGVVTYGIVEGTNIGYIYVRHQTSVYLPAQFDEAVHALENTEGLIVDLRLDYGGNYGLMMGIGRLTSYEGSTLLFKMRSSAADLEALTTYSGGGSNLSIPAVAGTMVGRPIAVLLGPLCRSYGDISARQFSYVPGVRFFGKSPAGAYSGWWYSPGVSIAGYTFWCPDVIEVDHRYPEVQLLNTEFPIDEDIWLTPEDVAKGEDTVVKRAIAWIQTVAHAHNVELSRLSADTVAILAKVENPLRHTLRAVATLDNGSGRRLDSLILADDGLHGDSAASDGLWGSVYVPMKDDTLHVHVRTDDLTIGTSRNLPNAATLVFTRGAIITMDTRTIDLGRVSMTTPYCDTTFVVRNVGYAADSLTISLDPGNVVPDTAVSAFPGLFMLAPGDSQKVTFRVRPNFLPPQYYSAQVVVQSKSAFGQKRFDKSYVFQVVVSSVARTAELPTEFALGQNYPNPFNPTTMIRYQLPVAGAVRVAVYDLLGREVAVLVDEEKAPGSYEVGFNATGFSSGMYLYRLTAGSFTQTRTMLLLK